MKFLRKVGKGAFGTVYKARNHRSGKIVAVKVLNHTKIDLQRLLSMTTRECEILNSLKHPNIVKMLGTQMGKNAKLRQVFEYVDGDLFKLIKNTRRLPMGFIKDVSRQILEGIEFCHLNQVIHRDIKPENILLTKKSVVKIADFGMATRVPEDPKTEMTCIVGTLWYRAPEILHGSKHYGTISDMWGVGCTIAMMLSGIPIFAGKSEENQRKMIAAACRLRVREEPDGTRVQYSWLSDHLSRICRFPPDLCDFLLRMLNPDPSVRMSATDALKHDWLKSDPNIPRAIYLVEDLFETRWDKLKSVGKCSRSKPTHSVSDLFRSVSLSDMLKSGVKCARSKPIYIHSVSDLHVFGTVSLPDMLKSVVKCARSKPTHSVSDLFRSVSLSDMLKSVVKCSTSTPTHSVGTVDNVDVVPETIIQEIYNVIYRNTDVTTVPDSLVPDTIFESDDLVPDTIMSGASVMIVPETVMEFDSGAEDCTHSDCIPGSKMSGASVMVVPDSLVLDSLMEFNSGVEDCTYSFCTPDTCFDIHNCTDISVVPESVFESRIADGDV